MQTLKPDIDIDHDTTGSHHRRVIAGAAVALALLLAVVWQLQAGDTASAGFEVRVEAAGDTTGLPELLAAEGFVGFEEGEDGSGVAVRPMSEREEPYVLAAEIDRTFGGMLSASVTSPQ